MRLTIELDREADGRWIANVAELGILLYGETRESAIGWLGAVIPKTAFSSSQEAARFRQTAQGYLQQAQRNRRDEPSRLVFAPPASTSSRSKAI